ncbi:MAG TPA: regulatory iron-sulfur-containing complex subunit RicT [Candidatus Polarisedimenticolia bacterium]|nr:regulatory iron-sulfur-containing complex subunit RicT [Candidatus Polarisedimenticolia bacterium]
METPPENEPISNVPPTLPAAGGCGCGPPAGRSPGGNEVAVVGVRLHGQVRVIQLNSGESDFEMGQRLVVEGELDAEIAEVVQPTTRARKMCSIGCMKKALRLATAEDLTRFESRVALEDEARDYCRKRIHERGLPMKLVRIEHNPETRKVAFYFTAEGRVDFRDLVKDLAQQFHSRIEMRQIGVRDEARVRGGYGDCGRALCCSTFLKEFAPVSIRMAREQNLSLNPSKISGMCGRLKCCLRYEYVPAGGEGAVPPEDEPLPPAPPESTGAVATA